jgi:hypothetical protein
MPEALLTLLLAGACLGDANGNGVIDGEDFGAYRLAYGSRYGEAGYNPLVDYDADGEITGADFAVLQQSYGQECRRIVAGAYAADWEAYCGPPAVVTWAVGATLPLWDVGCIRVPMVQDFTPTVSCDPERVWELETAVGEC